MKTGVALQWILISLFTPVVAETSANFTYFPAQGQVTITGHSNPVGDLVIPDMIEYLPVTRIGDEAFYGCAALTSIAIPDSVTHIGDAAFRGCTGLSSVTIPNSVTSFGYWTAFSGCTT